MNDLPFLVVHGAWVWKGVLVILVALTVAARLGMRWRAERKRVQRLAEVRMATTCAPREGEVMLRGRLRGGTAATLSRDDVAWDHGEGLWLDHEGEHIELASPVRVAAGARAATSYWRPPRGTPEALAKEWKRRSSRLDVISDGDEIIVDGKLERRGESDGDYRESGATWSLTGTTGVIGATAVTPAVRLRARFPLWPLASVAAFAGIWYGVLHKIGTDAYNRDQSAERDGILTAVPGNLALAAAMPGSRDKALSHLSYLLEDHFGHTEAAFQQQLAVDELRGECTAKLLLRAVRLEPALAAARACGDHEIERAALVYLGRYAEAAASPPSEPNTQVVAAVGAGKWADAAAAANTWAQRVYERPRSEYFTDEVATNATTAIRCVAAWYGARAGDASALAHVAEHRVPMCVLVDALAHGQPIEASQLEHEYRARSIAEAIGLAPRNSFMNGDFGAVDNLAFGFDAATWLVPFAIANAPRESAASMHARLATLAVYKGDLATARAELARAGELATKDPPSLDRRSLELAIALRDPAPFPGPTADEYVHPGIGDAVRLRRGTLSLEHAVMGAFPSPCESELRTALAQALAGDGGPLATTFRTCKVYWGGLQEVLFGVLPHVTAHRDELATALRFYQNTITTYDFDYAIFRFLDDVVAYRDLARLAGDTAAAADWQKLVDAHAQMLADRDRALGMLLWAAIR